MDRTMADDVVYRNEVLGALLEAGQKSRRYKLGDTWELNFDEIRDAIASVPSAQPTDCVPLHVVIDAITKIIRGAHPIEVIHQILPSAPPEKCEDCGNFNKTRLLIPQPELKKGHWIAINESAGIYECDQCHERVCCVGKYCMACGAKMEVGE